MTSLTRALAALQTWLKDRKIPFMVIGGVANFIWGEPRLTQDIDVTIQIPEDETEKWVADLLSSFRVLPKSPVDFVKTTRVLPLEIENVSIDLIFAGLDYEKAAITRALDVELGGIEIHTCTPEDLIIHKAISERQRDWEDIEGVLLRQGNAIDKSYVIKWLKRFAQALKNPDILKRFEKMWFKLVEE